MKLLRYFTILVLASAFAFPERDVALAYTFKAGDQYDYVSVTKQTVKQSLPGMGDFTTEVKSESAMKFKVAELTDTGARIEAQYVRLKIATNSTLVNVNMDSEGSADDTQNKIAKAMMNKSFFFTLAKTGNVEKVEGVDNIFSGLSSLGLDEATIAETTKSMEQHINENSLKATLGFINYPDKKIKPSDTWNSTTSMNQSFALQVNNAWNFKKLENGIAFIDGDGTITTPDKDKQMSLPNGLKAKTDLNGRQAVTAKVNAKTGWPTEIKTLSELKGAMTLLAGGILPTDTEVPMEIQGESNITITKK